MSGFDESKHPRDKNGRFAEKGNRRTRMAEAMAKSLCDDGYAAGMYYQMD